MTPATYRTALATLGLSQVAAGRWLGVSKATAQRYATSGPSAMARKLISLRVRLMRVERLHAEPHLGAVGFWKAEDGDWVSYDEIAAMLRI